jgi:hypothetical protein
LPDGSGPPLHIPASSHVWPKGHEAPVDPHWQPPEAVQAFDRVVSHCVHAVPRSRPQTGNVGVVQTVADMVDRQHPAPEQAAGSHIHFELLHSCPLPQAPTGPQLHAPPAHPSPVVPQLAHTLPFLPQYIWLVAVTHEPPTYAVQHPEHELESQTHCPETQTWSESHGGPFVPHLQSPLVHVSVVAGHWVQPPPAVPHSAAVAGMVHAEPEQQPVGHDCASHDGHVCPLHEPGRQLSHVAPPEPQLSSSVPGQQVEPLQHPVAHDDGPQRHMPLEQYWAPAAHGCPLVAPHVHTP